MHIYLPTEVATRIDENFGWYQKTLEAEGKRYTRTIDSALRDRTYYLCWQIITTRLFDSRTDEGKDLPAKSSVREFVNIPKDRMREYGGSKLYLHILSFLSEHDIVEVNEKYSKGMEGRSAFTKSYRLINVDVEKFTLKKVELTNRSLLKTVIKQRPPSADLPDYLHRYKKEILEKIHLSEEAEHYLIRRAEDRYTDFLMIEFYKAHLPIFSFQNGNSFSQDQQGRIYFPLNMLQNILRKHLRVKGNDLPPDWVEVDVSACAPFIFSCYLLRKGHRNYSVREFYELASKENFYEGLIEYCMKYLQHYFNEGHLDEEETVNALYKTIDKEENKKGGAKEWIKDGVIRLLNSKPSKVIKSKKYGPLLKALNICFPTVIEQLEELNQGRSAFYDTITPLETSVMVDFIIPRLLDSGIIAIVRHDGILCPSADAERVKELMEEGFQERIGAVPFIKVKGVT